MNRRGFLGGLFAAGVLAVHMKLGNLAPIPQPPVGLAPRDWDPQEAVTVIEVWEEHEHRAYWVDREGFVHVLSSIKGEFPMPYTFVDRSKYVHGN